MLGLFIASLNEIIDLQTSRLTAVIYARVPDTVLLLLFIGEVLTMGMVGYSAGLTRRRGILTAVVLVVVLSAVLTLVVDLDRPRDRYLQVSQQPLIDLQTRSSGPPSRNHGPRAGRRRRGQDGRRRPGTRRRCPAFG